MVRAAVDFFEDGTKAAAPPQGTPLHGGVTCTGVTIHRTLAERMEAR